MKINFSSGFVDALLDHVDYISKDKPSAARKFKNDLLQSLNKDLKQPFNYRKSIYFEDELIRDYIYRGYTIVFQINMKNQIIIVFGFIKHQDSLK